jgi:hypothetical protein
LINTIQKTTLACLKLTLFDRAINKSKSIFLKSPTNRHTTKSFLINICTWYNFWRWFMQRSMHPRTTTHF